LISRSRYNFGARHFKGGFRGWAYQDFSGVAGTALTLSANSNGNYIVFRDSRIINNSAVAVRTLDPSTKAYTGTSKLFSSKVEVTAHTGTSVTISGIPNATWGDLRIYYLYDYEEGCPDGYQQPTDNVSKELYDEIDSLFLTEEEATAGYAALTHASTHETGGADLVDHNSLTNFVANEHIDWTNATDNFSTTGIIDLNPAITSGTANRIVDITNSTALEADAHWTGFRVDGSNLSPTGADTKIRGLALNFYGMDMAYHSDLDILRIIAPSNSSNIDSIRIEGGKIRHSFECGTEALAHYTVNDIIIDASTQDATSEIHGFDVALTNDLVGTVAALGTHTDVDVIHQHIGTYVHATLDAVWDDAESTYSNLNLYDDIWVDVNDAICIGHTAKFDEIRLTFDTVATKDCFLRFYYWKDGGTWTRFYPEDDTDGGRQDGIIKFDGGGLTDWFSADPTGQGTGYWIKIERNRVNDPGTVNLKDLEYLIATSYYWDKDGNILANSFAAGGLTVDTDTLVVDAVNHRVGIGVAAPGHVLQVEAAGYDARIVLETPNTASYPGLEFKHNHSENHRAIIRSDYAAGSPELTFWTSTGGVIGERMVILGGGNVGINEVAPQDKLEVNGTVIVKDKLKFTQDDGNEYIDSLNDGYLDYGATTEHRFNNDVNVTGSLELEDTTTSTTGVVYKGIHRFLHNYHHPVGGGELPEGSNLFLGLLSGNFTTGETATQTYHASSNVGLGKSTLASLTTGYANVAIGTSALVANTTGFANVALGTFALTSNNAGWNNFGLGRSALFNCTYGHDNIAIGTNAMLNNVSGDYNVAIGSLAGQSAIGQSQDFNTFIGSMSALSITTGSSNIFLGYSSGYRQTTNSNLLIIDNQVRADIATELSNAIIYGVMAATPANQTIRLNAGVIMMADIPVADPTNAGQLWNNGGVLTISAG